MTQREICPKCREEGRSFVLPALHSGLCILHERREKAAQRRGVSYWDRFRPPLEVIADRLREEARQQ